MKTLVRGAIALAVGAAMAVAGADGGGIDLTMTALSGAPASVLAGQSFSLTNTVKTTGAVSKPFTVSLYLSTDSVIATTDTLIGSRTISSLGSNASSSATTTVTVPSTLAPGTYYVGALADSGKVIAETNENNNTILAASRITVTGSPDLTMTTLTGAPATIAAGASFTVTNTVTASAAAAVGSFVVGIYLSTDSVITTGDTLIGSRTVTSLAAGGQSTASTVVTVPGTLAAGTYYVGAIADSANQIAEANESNNSLAASQVRVLQPDLSVTSLSTPPGAIGVTDSFSVTDAVVADAAGSAAGTFTVGYYLSATPTVSTSGVLIGSRQVNGLAPGQTSTATTTLTIPSTVAPGTYYFGAIADSTGLVLESNEANNARASAAVVVGAYSCQHPATPIDDGNPCTVDACSPTAGVTHTPVAAGTSCSDGNVCNGLETCNAAGTCTAGTPLVVDDGNPCTIDSCDPTAGVIHVPANAGTSCSDANVCNGEEFCDGAGICLAGTPPSVDDGDPCTADSCVAGNGVIHTPIPNCSVLPPDPATVAPPTDRTVATDIASSTAFLYTGPNPIQSGVPPGTIEPQRVAVLRGRVAGRDGSGIGGVAVTVVAHPEFGSTQTRADGMFDMAVNGGGQLTLSYQKDGYLPAHRQVQAPWRDYAWADPVVLVQFDTVISTVQAGAGTVQVARGTAVTDGDGTRQATVLFPPGTQASMTLPDGSGVQLGTFHVRTTEYTVGDTGRAAMPAELPPTSAYTYAVELSVDEAVMTGAQAVAFSQAIPVYLENFLGIPVGKSVPAGYYDRQRATWVPSNDGRVLKVLSTSGGVAAIDADGDGVADSSAALAALGITPEELAQVASMYQPGQTLWRVPVLHFTPWDFNYGFGCEADSDGQACPPPTGDDPLVASGPEPDPDLDCGSVIDCENQGLGEDVSVVGTPYQLSYRSIRQLGRTAERTITIHPPTKISSKAVGLVYEVTVAGQRLAQRSSIAGSGTVTFPWDGRDAYGRPYQGAAPVVVRIGLAYRPVYAAIAAASGGITFGGSGAPTGVLGRTCGAPTGEHFCGGELIAWRTWKGTLSSWSALPEGLGGWTVGPHHTYDSLTNVVRRGDGTLQAGTPVDAHVITTFARTGWPVGIAVAPDGTIYTAEDWQVLKIATTGAVTRIAGGGSCSPPQSGIPALQACLRSVYDLSLGPDGSIYLAGAAGITDLRPVRRIRPDGIIEDVAGALGQDYSTAPVGDGGPALQARIGFTSGVAAGADGSVYVLADNRIRKVTPDGTIHGFAGNGQTCCNNAGCGTSCYSGDGGPAINAGLSGGGNYGKIAVGADGSVYLADPAHSVIRRVKPDGIIETFAGTTAGFSGDGQSARTAQLNAPEGVSVGADGSVYVVDTYNLRIRRISPAGIIETVAGSGQLGYAGDGGPAVAAALHSPWQALVGPSGALFIADSWNGAVRRVGAPLPGFTLADVTIASRDGTELYVFDTLGRHLRTLDARTRAVIHSFAYDGAGRLASVTDRDGLVTTIERVGGVPSAIVAPHGQRTALTVDANGYLAGIGNPAGEQQSYSYDVNGLMQTFTDPRSNIHTFHYDDLGRLDHDDNPAGGFKQLARASRADGYSISVTTALGRSALHDVKRLGTGDEIRTFTRADGSSVVRTERTSGTKTVASPDGTTASVTFGPDPQFGMQSPLAAASTVSTPAGVTRTTTQTASLVLSNPADVLSVQTRTDRFTVNGNTSTVVYDAATRALNATSAAGRAVTATLDATGRIATLQPPGVPAISFGRDASGHLRTVTQGARVSTIDYDTAGFPWQVTDPAGRQVQLHHDAAGRVDAETLPGPRAVGLGYDASGNLSSVTPPGQPAHGLLSDAVDRLATYTPPLVAGAGSLVTTYAYDADGALSQVLLPDSSAIVPGYDTAGRLATVTTARGVFTVNPDGAGRVQSVGTPEGDGIAFGYDGFLPLTETATGRVPGVVSRTFDSSFREATISVNGAAVASFGYDADGLVTQAGALSVPRDPATGRVGSTTLGVVATTPGYNAYSELDSVTARANGATVYAYALHRDASGKIAGKTETVQGVTSEYVYTPDAAGRLWTVTKDGVLVEQYAYDDNGNRLSGTNSAGTATGSYDAQDRMTAYGAATYTYGPNGDLRTRTIGGQTTTYSYDSLGNLLAVWLPDGRVIEYVVDGLNRRVGKKLNGALVEGFLYDGQLRPVAWLDGTGAVKATFVYGLHVNVPEYMTSSAGTFRIIHDHLGSPRLVVDSASGSVVQRMDYDSFGQVLSDTNPGFQPFGFAGGLYDRDTSLVRFGARDYDPSVGRWTNKDPIRFGGGWNLYAYATNDPVNYIDPSGLYTGVDDAVFTLGGALVGLLGQAASDMMSGNLSGWEDYAGAAVGGAVTGEALLYVGPFASGAAGGLLGDFTKQWLKNQTGKQCGYDLGSLALNTGLGAATGFISGRGIPGISSGRNSYNAIFKQMVTKFENGTASSVTTETALKMFIGRGSSQGFFEGTLVGAGVNAGLDGLLHQ